MRYLAFDGDVCIAESDRPRAGFIPYNGHTSMSHARLLDGDIVDASLYTRFYVCEKGLKHINDAPDRQAVECHIDEPLLYEPNLFRRDDETNL